MGVTEKGAPVLLMHGYPQTHVLWHKVAPKLAEKFSVVAADLRGYGDSSKPADGEKHANYSKRATLDIVPTYGMFHHVNQEFATSNYR